MRITFALTLLLSLSSCAAPAYPRTLYPGQWAQVEPEKRDFFKLAERPDMQGNQPCCGEADAYEADDFETDRAGHLYAIITETESAIPYCSDADKNIEVGKCKIYLKPGTRIIIPPEKILRAGEPVNRTGHGYVFLAANSTFVFCYSYPSGI